MGAGVVALRMGEPDRPAWYLPVGERPDQARADLLAEGFRAEVVRVGRALRRRMEAERPGATMTARLYEPRHLLGPHGYTRSDRLHGIGLGHLVVGGGFGADVIPVCVGWADGRVYAVVPRAGGLTGLQQVQAEASLPAK